MYTLSPKTIKDADALAVSKYGISELTLMKNAAKSCHKYIYTLITKNDRVTILCGKGNNGGDGYEIASLLKNDGFDITVINVFDTIPGTDTAKHVFDDCLKNGVNVLAFAEYEKVLSKSTVIIDAVFGVGFYGSIDKSSDLGKLFSLCNGLDVLRIAIDTPSGINSADGTCRGIAFAADHTITMAYIKTGMVSYPAKKYCGNIMTADIEYPKELCDEILKDALIPDDDYIKTVIPKRSVDSHKGTYGRLLMFCGCQNMTGAAILSAKAALRSGAGLVNIARDKGTIRILQSHLTEPIFSPISENAENDLLSLSEKATAVLTGCGLGTSEYDKNALYSLIKNANCNLIIDADGINLICENTIILKEAKKPPILTPHPLEFSRLLGKTVSEIQQDRINCAKSFAKEYRCVLVLKGAATVIASPDGRLAVNTTGNPGLAKGGSGDVLAGVISSLCAQGLPPFESAVCGVYLHGKAADILKETIGEYGMLPSDLPLEIAKLLP
ncbi:MAG: NAD(P)H-hydrate dehydratase [Ruminococcaceae bacterium]|nr:NAD(P)H-hydrate dehydratase [Oscillospiraceae bacterium]